MKAKPPQLLQILEQTPDETCERTVKWTGSMGEMSARCPFAAEPGKRFCAFHDLEHQGELLIR